MSAIDFDNNCKKVKDILTKLEKYNIATFLKEKKATPEEILGFSHFQTAINKVETNHPDADFSIIILIRLLYFSLPEDPLAKTIISAIQKFYFWPDLDDSKSPDLSKIVFWSENHILMILSSKYLIDQYPKYKDQNWDKSFEHECLLKYLTIHCHKLFNGVYEVCSHVYLPYSLCALLNLYDFAENTEVKELAKKIINRIVYQLILVTEPLKGSGTLSASARAFPRTRQRNFGHNVNALINLIHGESADTLNNIFVLTDFLLTTGWKPESEIEEALNFTGFKSIPFSHSLEDFDTIYQARIIDSPDENDEYLPLYWSGGVIVHPKFAKRTRKYIKKKKLTNNVHLWPLFTFFMSDDNLMKNMDYYRHFSTGQIYTGITLNVFKVAKHGLVLSSFELYNPHFCGFQQLPWMANISGVPIWSQSGAGNESIAGFGIHNTHNPAVQQRNNILLVTYIAPTLLTDTLFVGSLFSYDVHLYYPSIAFDETYRVVYKSEPSTYNQYDQYDLTKQKTPAFSLPSLFSKASKKNKDLFWIASRKENCYVAILSTSTFTVTNPNGKNNFSFSESISKSYRLSKLSSTSKAFSWIVVVSTTDSYSSIDSFIQEKLSTIKFEQSGNNINYKIDVFEDSKSLISYQYSK